MFGQVGLGRNGTWVCVRQDVYFESKKRSQPCVVAFALNRKCTRCKVIPRLHKPRIKMFKHEKCILNQAQRPKHIFMHALSCFPVVSRNRKTCCRFHCVCRMGTTLVGKGREQSDDRTGSSYYGVAQRSFTAAKVALFRSEIYGGPTSNVTFQLYSLNNEKLE